MALKRNAAEYWSATQAIAYIGFDIPNPSRGWQIAAPTEDQRAVIVAAVSEILGQVEARNLAPDWNGERDEYGDAPELTNNARGALINKAMGILNLGGDSYRNLQFKKSDIEALWTANEAPVQDNASAPADSIVADDPAPVRRDKKQTMAAFETWAREECQRRGRGINRDDAHAWGQSQNPKITTRKMNEYFRPLDDALKQPRGAHGPRVD